MSSNIKIKKINSEISSIIIDEQKTYNSLSFQNLNDLLKALSKSVKFLNDKELYVFGSSIIIDAISLVIFLILILLVISIS